MTDLREHLQRLFGLDDFRPSQREVIEDVLRGRDVLCVMPTGAGKSLCYQLPAAIRGGLSIVVSPLISLMADQVQQLRDEGLPTEMLNSSQTAAEQRGVLAQLDRGFSGILYVAPERFVASSFQHLIDRLKPTLFAVDEAHCISMWGHDFRTEYSKLGEIRVRLGSPPTIALTATATEDVREDIIHQLHLVDPNVVVTGFDRPNLRYESRRMGNDQDKKDEELLRLLRQEPGSAIVYCATRKHVDELSAMLPKELNGRVVVGYHAGLDPATRTANQERFMNTDSSVAVATNAFGMGINKPNIRMVVHYNLTGTLEAYYQEAGRAGRDGQPSRCVMLFSYQDRYTQDFFIEKLGQDSPDIDPKLLQQRKKHATDKLELMLRYAQTHRCRRQMILDYFGDPADAANCRCDVCAREEQWFREITARREGKAMDVASSPLDSGVIDDDTVTLVRQLLSGIARCNGRFGVGVVAEVLAGGKADRIDKWRLNQLSCYGLLRLHGVTRVIAMLHRLMECGLARQRDPDGVRFRPMVELTAAGIAVMKGQTKPPTVLGDLLPKRAAASRRAAAPILPDRPPEPEEFEVDPMAAGRFERLRAVRLEISRIRGVPPYIICTDMTLRMIARYLPADANALEQIKGMGPIKVKMYGQALLDVIKELK